MLCQARLTLIFVMFALSFGGPFVISQFLLIVQITLRGGAVSCMGKIPKFQSVKCLKLSSSSVRLATRTPRAPSAVTARRVQHVSLVLSESVESSNSEG